MLKQLEVDEKKGQNSRWKREGRGIYRAMPEYREDQRRKRENRASGRTYVYFKAAKGSEEKEENLPPPMRAELTPGLTLTLK